MLIKLYYMLINCFYLGKKKTANHLRAENVFYRTQKPINVSKKVLIWRRLFSEIYDFVAYKTQRDLAILLEEHA